MIKNYDVDVNSIDSVADFCHKINEDKGFNDDWTNSPEQIMNKLFLINSEIAEAGEELRDGRMDIWYQDNGKPEGFGTELADALIRIVTLAKLTNTDLKKALYEKIAYNMGRPHNHGRVMKV